MRPVGDDGGGAGDGGATAAQLIVNGFPCQPAQMVSAINFTSNLLKKRGDTSNNLNHAVVMAASVLNFFGSNTLRISSARVDFDQGGINPPLAQASHRAAPRGLGRAVRGLRGHQQHTVAVFIRESELFVFRRGLVHFQLNVGKGEALAFATLGSQNPDVQTIAPALFANGMSDEVLERDFHISEDIVKLIEKNSPQPKHKASHSGITHDVTD